MHKNFLYINVNADVVSGARGLAVNLSLKLYPYLMSSREAMANWLAGAFVVRQCVNYLKSLDRILTL